MSNMGQDADCDTLLKREIVMTAHNRLLIIDDDPEMRALLRLFAERLGYSVEDGGAGDETLELFEETEPTVVFLDLNMPERDGVEMLRELSERGCKAPIVLTSGASERLLSATKRIGRDLGLMIPYVLNKPINERFLRGVLSKAWHNEFTPTPESLEQAIKNDEMVVHYQPKIGFGPDNDISIVGSEALVRWQHPAKGLIAPSSFINIAEESDLVGALTDSVLDQVITQMQNWSERSLELPVSINLSPVQLVDIDLPNALAGRLEKASLNPALMTFEVTEQTVYPNTTIAVDILTRMRLKGFGVSLDDFGSGFSSIAEIYRLPLSEVKIDRSITRAAEDDMDARKVFKAIVDLAHSFELEVCAEGVETERGVQYLRSVGCDTAQGFYFSKPLPAGHFYHYISKFQEDLASDRETLNIA